jgi:hypothetical protein
MMNELFNHPDIQLLTWRSEERALLARVEIRRQLRERSGETARRAALPGPIGTVLGQWEHWLMEAGALVQSITYTRQAEPRA